MPDLTEILRTTLRRNGKPRHDMDPVRMLVAQGVSEGVKENGAVISKELSVVLERIFLLDRVPLPAYYGKDSCLIVRAAQALSVPSSNPFLRNVRNVGTNYARELAEKELRKTRPGIRIHLPDPLRRTITYMEDEAGLARYVEAHILHDHGCHYVLTLNSAENAA